MVRRPHRSFAALRALVLVAPVAPGLALAGPAVQEPPSQEPQEEAPAEPAPTVLLRTAHETERVFWFRLEHENSTRALGEEGAYRLELDVRCTLGPEGGTALVDGAAVTFRQGTQRLAFDSRQPDAAKPVDEPAREVVLGLVGDELRFGFDEQGSVTAVEGTGALMTPAAARLTKLLDANGMERSLDVLFAPSLEPAPLAVGEGWTIERPNELTPQSTLVLAVRYRVAEIAKGRARLAVTGDARMKHEGTRDGLMPWPTVESARVRGSAEWNTELGVMERYELALDLEVRGLLPGRADERLVLRQVTRAQRLDGPPAPAAETPAPPPETPGEGAPPR